MTELHVVQDGKTLRKEAEMESAWRVKISYRRETDLRQSDVRVGLTGRTASGEAIVSRER